MSVKTLNRNLGDLVPWLRPVVEEFLSTASVGEWRPHISEGFRSCERQNFLYSQGRTRKGSKVTNAKCGQSMHQRGMAIDIFFKNKKDEVNWSLALFDLVAPVAKKLGMKWGGDWLWFKDRTHFYMTVPPKQNKDFARKWMGRMILDTEDAGKLYYVDFEGLAHYLDPRDIETFQNLGEVAEGFTHKDILRIPKYGE